MHALVLTRLDEELQVRNVQQTRRVLRSVVVAAATTALAVPLAVTATAQPVSAQAQVAAAVDDAAAEPFDALVFSKTAGFRHGSIPAGIQAITQLGAANDFTVTATEDGGVFTDEGLADYEVVVFLSTTGDVLSDEQQAAFERYIQGGGGYAGIHAASDTEYA